jgi:hypothetical protein
MKLITEKAIQFLEDKYDCIVLTDKYDLTLSIMWLSDEGFELGKTAILKDQIPYVINNTKKRIVFIKQSDLYNIVPTLEERVWLVAKKQKATPVSEMDHQRLSNCVGLLELMLKKGRISKNDADDYILSLSENIVPELMSRFKGEILPYKPYYPWEKDLLKLPDVK